MTTGCDKQKVALARALIQQCTKNETYERPPDSPPSVPTPHSLPFNVEELRKQIYARYKWTLDYSSIEMARPSVDGNDESVRIYISLDKSEQTEVALFETVNGTKPDPVTFPSSGDSHVYYHVHNLNQAHAVITMFQSYIMKKKLKSTAKAIAGGVRERGGDFLAGVHCRYLKRRYEQIKNDESKYHSPGTLVELEKLDKEITSARCDFPHNTNLRPVIKKGGY